MTPSRSASFARRRGGIPTPRRPWLRQGKFVARTLTDQLPANVSLSGARVLDFGCGAGRVLRHLIEDVGDDGELHGVDIDRPSIDWLQANASPPLHAATCGELPSLPYPDEHFDLVYAMSVFTHLTEHWAGWLLQSGGASSSRRACSSRRSSVVRRAWGWGSRSPAPTRPACTSARSATDGTTAGPS